MKEDCPEFYPRLRLMEGGLERGPRTGAAVLCPPAAGTLQQSLQLVNIFRKNCANFGGEIGLHRIILGSSLFERARRLAMFPVLQCLTGLFRLDGLTGQWNVKPQLLLPTHPTSDPPTGSQASPTFRRRRPPRRSPVSNKISALRWFKSNYPK